MIDLLIYSFTVLSLFIFIVVDFSLMKSVSYMENQIEQMEKRLDEMKERNDARENTEDC